MYHGPPFFDVLILIVVLTLRLDISLLLHSTLSIQWTLHRQVDNLDMHANDHLGLSGHMNNKIKDMTMNRLWTPTLCVQSEKTSSSLVNLEGGTAKHET